MLFSGQSGCIGARCFNLGKSGFIMAKAVVF